MVGLDYTCETCKMLYMSLSTVMRWLVILQQPEQMTWILD